MRKTLWLMPVTLIIALVLSLSSLAIAQSQFKVSDLSISPNFITAGEEANITISVKIENVGTEAGTYTSELMINDAVETPIEVTLDAGAEEKVVIPVSKSEAGEYTVAVENLTGSFSVAPANLEIKNLLIDPIDTSPDKEVIISVTAQNTSTEQSLTYDSLKLFINGKVVDEKLIDLEAGESATISFTVTESEVGNYVVQLGTKTGAFNVKASFLSSLPPLVWGVIGVIALIIILIVVMTFTSPKRKRAKLAAKKGGAARASQPSPVQPISVQPTHMQQMSSQQQFGPQQPSYPGQPQQIMSQYPGQAQQMSPQQQFGSQQPSYPGQPQQTPQRATPQYPGQAQQMSPQQQFGSQQPSYPGQPQQRPGYPMQPIKPEQPVMPQTFMPQTQQVQPGMFPGRSIPQFSVGNLNITPQQAKEGDPINISAVVTNNTATTSQYSMVLRIGGVVENISELNLNPGSSQTALFTIIKDTPGEYYVEVDGQRGMFTIIHRLPAAFAVSNLSISPEKVKQGDPVTISAIVTNTGETAGNYSVVLRIKGIAESIEEVELGPSRSQKVVFNITKDAAGFYPVALENLSGKFVVEMDWKG